MQRKGSAIWEGNLTEGKGKVSTESGILNNTQYSFSTRFEQGKGTNPEELLAAAHASCFAMALSNELGNYGIKPNKLEVNATITLDKTSDGFSITKSHLELHAFLPSDANEEKFNEAAAKAKLGCPVSKLYKAEITLNTKVN